ncbi:hypothetical protein DB347_18025 [Opitutaceae bacterium EW11]|nr:hypothetical protein DB347_18025 [Opitutaceae bacterium EW11]
MAQGLSNKVREPAAFLGFLWRLLLGALGALVCVAAVLAFAFSKAGSRIASFSLVEPILLNDANIVADYVCDGDGVRLPSHLRVGTLSSGEVSHLTDVQQIVVVGRRVSFALFFIFAISLGFCSKRSRAWVARASFVVSVAFGGGFAALGCLNWRGSFILVHLALFREGSWQFTSDAYLLQLFPARFWALTALSVIVAESVVSWSFWRCLSALAGHRVYLGKVRP